MQAHKDERSLGDLFGDLARETSTLVRQEVELAKTEMSQKATRVGKDIGFLVAGGAVAYAGFLALIAAIAIGLGQLGVPWWLATLLVALVVGGIGGVLVMQGLNALKRETIVPERTMQTLKEDVEWAKAQTK
jgi:tetrahydromethanopterin S-methyltransferase subunit G